MQDCLLITRILDFFIYFICICTDTVVVLNYALFVYLYGVWDSSVCFETQDARILSSRLSTCDMPDMLCRMLAVLTGACSTQLFKPLVRTTCYFQGAFTTMAPICVVFVCIYMCVKIFLLYYSVIAQFKLTLFSPFLAAVVAVPVSSTLFKGIFCVCGCVQFGYCKTLISANTTTRSSHRAACARALTRAHTHTSIPLLRLVCRLSPQHYENEHVDRFCWHELWTTEMHVSCTRAFCISKVWCYSFLLLVILCVCVCVCVCVLPGANTGARSLDTRTHAHESPQAQAHIHSL